MPSKQYYFINLKIDHEKSSSANSTDIINELDRYLKTIEDL